MSLRWKIFIGSVAVVVGATVWFMRPSEESPALWEVRGRSFHLIFAKSPYERQQGLSGRAYLGRNEAMLFMFPDRGRHGIWMKDMRFAIDIVWLDDERRIVHIEEDVLPDSYPNVYEPGVDARYVVELNRGTVRALGWVVGQQVEAWPSG